MPKVAIITDSNSGISQAQAKELGIYVVPMPFTIDEVEYKEDINLSQEQFFKMLTSGSEISTSMPALGDLAILFNQVLESYDEIVYLPMSSGLSSSYEASTIFAQENYPDTVYVVNNQRISVSLKSDVFDALKLVNQGKTGKEIKELLEENKFNSTIYIMVETLTYLKKGGRITPAAASIAGLLKIKPILSIYGEKLDLFSKTRTVSKAYKIMLEAVMKDINRISPDGNPDTIYIGIAHTNNLESAKKMEQLARVYFPNYEFIIDNLSLSIACHIGPGSVGFGCMKKTNV